MERKLTLALLVTATLLGTGCARKNTKPSCPVPDGVKCMSTVDVYERTHGSDFVYGGGVPQQATHVATSNDEMRVSLQDDALALVTDRQRGEIGVSDTNNEEPPVRTPARVMRVWIGAWQDGDGGLHMPSHVFKEIEPRRWRIGTSADPETGTFRLLDGLGVQAEQDAQPTANANAGGGHPSSSR